MEGKDIVKKYQKSHLKHKEGDQHHKSIKIARILRSMIIVAIIKRLYDLLITKV